MCDWAFDLCIEILRTNFWGYVYIVFCMQFHVVCSGRKKMWMHVPFDEWNLWILLTSRHSILGKVDQLPLVVATINLYSQHDQHRVEHRVRCQPMLYSVATKRTLTKMYPIFSVAHSYCLIDFTLLVLQKRTHTHTWTQYKHPIKRYS